MGVSPFSTEIDFRAFNGPVSLKQKEFGWGEFAPANFRAFNGPVSLKPVNGERNIHSTRISGPSTARSH